MPCNWPHAILVFMGLVVSGIVGCSSSSGPSTSSPSPGSPNPNQSANDTNKSDTKPAITPRSFEDAVKSEGIAIKINDREFLRRLNEARRDPVYVQHGQLLLGTAGIKDGHSYCQFGIGNGFADDRAPYQVDTTSLKQVGHFGAYSIQFSLGKLIGVECGNPQVGHDPLTVSDLEEIFGPLLTIITGNEVLPSSTTQSGLGTKIELLKGQDGTPKIGIQFAFAREKVIAMTFSVQGNQLVGAKAGTISPSFIAVVNKESSASYYPWSSTGLGNGHILPGSSQAFMIAIDDEAKAKDLIRSFRASAIIFSLKNSTPSASAYIDLGDLCERNPEKFVNLDTGDTGCP